MKTKKRGAKTRSGRIASNQARVPSKDHNAWQIPEAIYPLRDWLKQRYVDVGSLKSPRQALLLTVNLSGLRIVWPKKGQEFPMLLDLQRRVTGKQPPAPNPAGRRKHTSKLGAFGAASEVRKIDPKA